MVGDKIVTPWLTPPYGVVHLEVEVSGRAAILTARMRNMNCDLNNLLSKLMSLTDKCTMCNRPETTEHFLFSCTRYDRLRSDIVKIIPIECFNICNLYNPPMRYSDELNLDIQLVFQNFILVSNRFYQST